MLDDRPAGSSIAAHALGGDAPCAQEGDPSSAAPNVDARHAPRAEPSRTLSAAQASDATRTLRADARRNRDAILAAAQATFESEGVFASLDGIAARAGVGNATLYRNFPSREDLLAAVVEVEIDTACRQARDLLAGSSPGDALAQWLFELTWRLRIWHDLPVCLAGTPQQSDSVMTPTVSSLLEATAALLLRAQSAGQADRSITAQELYELITALSWAIDHYGTDEPAARRRVALATAGVFRV